jgi:hypothetical protein
MSNRPCSSKIINTTEIVLVALEITSTLVVCQLITITRKKYAYFGRGINLLHRGVLGNIVGSRYLVFTPRLFYTRKSINKITLGLVVLLYQRTFESSRCALSVIERRCATRQ